ncbi:conserved protein of unknown function [Candidatus Filomicrobium marinum]|uniref:Uncharacterized protein n=1 Tax=Candidatus Filomicrobium marinum TaxID=1608628 RepID=A0A0D6JF04_9HYPH|nr:hypothetical protein [Candidatus Filomicrobium marinum]CFX24228.1 conserved protein of unknown function [Candidatus Filomicrobium marinum]CPR19143.1 conserved protein of unknown function [Candidatus Filomicrobium marinum]
MTKFTKLDAIRKHLRFSQPEPQAAARNSTPAPATGKRVQKNLSILEQDAERLKALAKRDGISQAQLLSAALDVYESHHEALGR